MFHELASIVVQLNRYLTLFPESSELQECTRTLIEEYVGFSVSAFLFFKKWPLYNFLRLFWSTIDKKYQAARLSIANHYARFERSRQYTVDSTLIGNSTKIIQLLPTVAVLPALSSGLFEVPFLRNPHFCERDEEIVRIWTHLTQPRTGDASFQRACLLQGLGGVGKTSIALEYAYRHRDNYDFVLWLPAETDLAVSNAAATISRKLKLGPRSEAEKEPRLEVERFRAWLETLGKQWLLVLDNVENLSAVSAVWPRVDQGHLLLTSQRSDLAQVCSSTIVVNTLDKASGSRLLLKHLALTQPPPTLSSGPERAIASSIADDVQCKAEAIAAELSGVPLAITFVAGIYSSMNLGEILMELQQNTSFATLMSPEASPVIAHYDKPFGITWDTARKQLSSKALLLVQTLAMLSPTGVSEDVILAGDPLSNLSMFGLGSKSQ
ncbi:nb-arc [Cordyceps fumosorosea ARSEF 2679]|uniref:Nb-arc n=1 Tax=Cordyceps fumosorosea (strain ARSEF 2679) TaxID=1081104 RepID=A0A167EAG0_CORFA|nr:nb-arc [Cordyceps fumosorosea ARSEF 2679]OAA43581.1 nb-arc [Cordyceps fumosorosea ARSEF 2679]